MFSIFQTSYLWEKTRTERKSEGNKKFYKFLVLFAILLAVILCIYNIFTIDNLQSSMLHFTNLVAKDALNEELDQNIKDLLSKLDIAGLEAYLNSLTDEQKAIFGGTIFQKIAQLLTGDFNLGYKNIFTAIQAQFLKEIKAFVAVFCMIIAIAILCGLLQKFKSSIASRGTGKLIFFVGYSAITVLILSGLIAMVKIGISTANSLKGQMQAIFPVLLTLMATSGGAVSVAVYQPAVLFLTEIAVTIITTIIFPLAMLIAVLHIVGNLNQDIKLQQFCDLFASIIKWVLGITLTVFTVFLTVQGITSATYDGISFKAAKYAISNSVPIIGGFLGGGLDMIMAGSALIKNAVGSCGIILLAIVILLPLLQYAVYNLFLKLSSSVVEPLGVSGVSSLLASISKTVNYFIAGLLGVGFMYFVTILLLICSSTAFF